MQLKIVLHSINSFTSMNYAIFNDILSKDTRAGVNMQYRNLFLEASC